MPVKTVCVSGSVHTLLVCLKDGAATWRERLYGKDEVLARITITSRLVSLHGGSTCSLPRVVFSLNKHYLFFALAAASYGSMGCESMNFSRYSRLVIGRRAINPPLNRYTLFVMCGYGLIVATRWLPHFSRSHGLQTSSKPAGAANA